MRSALDAFYAIALWLAIICFLLIAILVGLQVGGRLVDAILKAVGARPTGFVILSLSEIAGYLLAAASFMGLAATLKSGVHIRVTMLINNVPLKVRSVLEGGALLFGAIASSYATWHLGKYAYASWRFNEVSPGLIPIQLVYPQSAMVVGAALLALAFFDEFLITLRTGRPSFSAAEEAISLGKEV
ncbi:MAG: TRAP transporter small permease [Salinarimonadaceae bacterium]|nr:MAG: TRAP transporter small permease [Salinarimonadaceae bacterium]